MWYVTLDGNPIHKAYLYIHVHVHVYTLCIHLCLPHVHYVHTISGWFHSDRSYVHTISGLIGWFHSDRSCTKEKKCTVKVGKASCIVTCIIYTYKLILHNMLHAIYKYYSMSTLLSQSNTLQHGMYMYIHYMPSYNL